jgi:hypothetical protein
MNIIQLFWEKTIEVYYQPYLTFNVANGVDRNYVVCHTYAVPKEVMESTYANVDYGVFLDISNELNGVSAFSYPCAFSITNKQPTWGLVNWNLRYFKYDLISFQALVKTGIHEFTHILGFSSILYDHFLHGKYLLRPEGSYLNGSFIQRAIKDQFGCTTAPGMPLESGGSSGTA